jgi:hypothetical protein
MADSIWVLKVADLFKGIQLNLILTKTNKHLNENHKIQGTQHSVFKNTTPVVKFITLLKSLLYSLLNIVPGYICLYFQHSCI